MKDKYDEFFDEIEKLYTEEAKPLLSEEKIKSTLEKEKDYIDYAREAGINPGSVTHGNTAKHCKDMLRKDQPLYFIYYLLGLFTSISYCILFWIILKCTALYLTGNKDIFQSDVPISYSIYVVTIYLIFNDLIYYIKRKSTSNDRLSSTCHLMRIVEILLITGGCTTIYILSATNGLIHLSILNAFLITVALLFLSGIHNVIYSSRFISFFTIGIMTITRKPSELIDDIITDYIDRNNNSNENIDRQLKNDRIYCFIGLFMAAVLDIICLRQTLKHQEITLILFFISVIIITVLLFTAIISCNKVIKALKKLH